MDQLFNMKSLEDMLENNKGLIRSQACFLNPSSKEEIDECIAIGNYAFIRAYHSYCSEKSKFSTYASTCIRNAIKDYYSYKDKHKAVQVDLSSRQDRTNINIDDYLPDSLTELERTIVSLKISGHKYNIIANRLNLSIDEIKSMFKSIKNKIRESNT
jgi:RNA polymerase sigma factor (sigma-70 family)